MSDSRITELPEALSVGDDDILYLVQDDTSKKIPKSTFKNSVKPDELIDIRIGADGTIYDSAGEAVREQIGDLSDAVGTNIYLAAGTDLNNCIIRGFYRLHYGDTYPNTPLSNSANIYKFLEVFVNETTIVQRFTAYNPTTSDNSCYFRIKTAGNWVAWVKGYDHIEFVTDFFQGRSMTGITDFNSCTEMGYYHMSYSATYSNDPSGPNNRRMLEVFKSKAQTYMDQRLTVFTNNSVSAIYVRYKSSGSWSSWTCIYNANDLVQLSNRVASLENSFESVDFTASPQSNYGENKGINVKAMSYNVANYNNDTSTYISDAKILNFRRMLNQNDADFICIQEDRANIDSSNTKNTSQYLYNPKYSDIAGSGGVTIRSKISLSNKGIVTLTGSRYMRYATATIDGKTILIASAHPVHNYNNTGRASAESIAMRLSQYTDIFDWLDGNIALVNTDTGNPIYVPTHTHTILCMDANSVTATDRTNLETLAENHNCVLGNGGYIGWYITELTNTLALDNIICSNNIIINNVEPLARLYSDLYSDHVPVIADLTIL